MRRICNPDNSAHLWVGEPKFRNSSKTHADLAAERPCKTEQSMAGCIALTDASKTTPRKEGLRLGDLGCKYRQQTNPFGSWPEGLTVLNVLCVKLRTGWGSQSPLMSNTRTETPKTIRLTTLPLSAQTVTHRHRLTKGAIKEMVDIFAECAIEKARVFSRPGFDSSGRHQILCVGELGNPPDLGSGDRWFESIHGDQIADVTQR